MEMEEHDKRAIFRDIGMDSDSSHRRYLIYLGILALSAITLYLRIIPLLTLGSASPLSLISPDDPTYNLKLVELYVKNLEYAWYDPFTYFPYGLWTNWGPLFTVIGAGASILFGATTPEQIAGVVLYIPPLLAAACVPVAYFAGKQLGNWKTGLIAATFIAFVGGQFFHRSVAGYFDHHTAEVFFSFLFIACYIWAIKNRDRALIQTKKYLVPGIPVWVTIGSFVLFVLTMPTAILFAFAVFIFTCIWMLWKHDKNLMWLNTLSFIGISLFYLIFINWHVVFNLDSYSIVHIAAYVAIIGAGLIFTWKNGKYWWVFAVIAVVGMLLLPPVRDFLFGTLHQFFGQTQYTQTVQEARGWDLGSALQVFGITIPLTVAGIGLLVYKLWKEHKPELLFTLVWVVLIFVSTIQHVRYEYYYAPVAAICSAYLLGQCLEYITTLKPKPVYGKKKPRSGTKVQVPKKNLAQPILTIVTLSMVGVFVISSLPINYAFASTVKMGTNPDWIEPLVWMRNNTPSVGLDPESVYTTEYTYPQERYNYPAESYGVMSWWDYGHLIEYYAQRPPNANPFQAGVFGYYGAANFFTTNDEDVALDIASNLGTRYVVTDVEMASAKFWAMATWANRSVDDYQTMLLFDGNPQTLFKKDYYETMVARLHVFDGSYRTTDHVIYIEHQVNPPNVIRAARVNNTTEAYQALARSSIPAVVAGDGIFMPTGEVDALKHFRLVHESPTDTGNGLHYVKVFEIVRGYDVKGEGLIMTRVTTNTGRQFNYYQESENGMWTLPYAGTYVKENGELVEVG